VPVRVLLDGGFPLALLQCQQRGHLFSCGTFFLQTPMPSSPS
jgi:hypothetical protein